MRNLCSTAVLVLVFALGESAAAAQGGLEPPPVAAAAPEEPPAAGAPESVGAPGASALPSFALGAELGGTIPFSTLGSQVAAGLEIGYLLPVLERRLELLAGVGWAPPQRSFTDGPYQAEVTQHELHFSVGPRYRFLDVLGQLNFSVAAGARLYLLRSVSAGTAKDQKFLEYREQSTHLSLIHI